MQVSINSSSLLINYEKANLAQNHTAIHNYLVFPFFLNLKTSKCINMLKLMVIHHRNPGKDLQFTNVSPTMHLD